MNWDCYLRVSIHQRVDSRDKKETLNRFPGILEALEVCSVLRFAVKDLAAVEPGSKESAGCSCDKGSQPHFGLCEQNCNQQDQRKY